MNKKNHGCNVCLIAGETVCNKVYCSSFIYVRRFILNAMNFAAGLEYCGNGLLIFSIISLVVGTLILGAEIEDIKEITIQV